MVFVGASLLAHPPLMPRPSASQNPNPRAGKKILMSGGSRCNILPMHVDLNRDFFTEGSRTQMKAVFASWSLPRCRAW